MNCSKCKSTLKWINRHPIKGKIWYCEHCGYNFRRNIFGTINEYPIYAIGNISWSDKAILFFKKKDLKGFVKDIGEVKLLPNSKR